ncbi:MAG: hypothetical protein E7282_00975 [Lachnospiraceae bacterium]|jgi:hypothetical protein|nr:hypothetical protein [Lachnospiraceae bacterium]
MNVSGVRPYAGFYQYNSIKLNEARNTQIAAAEAVNSQTAPANQNASAQQERPEQTFSSYDFAQQYNPDETFDLKGANSDINMLDVQKAVSDLDKDTMLQQYQYFVDSNPEDVGSAALRIDENFSL